MAIINGTAGDDLTEATNGTNGPDTINLFSGNDQTRPGDGADAIFGGSGTDRVSYLFSDSGVIVDLDAGVGSAGYAAGDTYNSIENVFGSQFDDTIDGDSNSNSLSGFLGNDTIDGADGSDTVIGDDGNDFLYGGSSHDFLFGGDDSDRLFGGSGNDVMLGGAGVDSLYGGLGDDLLAGGAGADTFNGGDGDDVLSYFDSTVGVTVNLETETASGGDATGDTFRNIEGLEGSAHADSFTGDSADNFLFGGSGNDRLYGGAGNDELSGGNDNDSLYGGADADELTGGNGNNSLYGGSGGDHLIGGDDRDRLYGGTGADTLEGGLGFDYYEIDNVGDVIVGEIGFSQGGGIDTVRSFIDFTAPQHIDIVRLGNATDTDNLNGTLNSAPGTLVGNAGQNILTGGFSGDKLNGNAGNDILIGNRGGDTLAGASGADTFVYNSVLDSRVGPAERDFVNGFSRGFDLIDLSNLDANLNTGANDAFSFIGSAGYSGTAGEVRITALGTTNSLLIRMDLDGDRQDDMQIFVNQLRVMGAEDFIL